MGTMFIKSKVRDYEVWKPFYDGFAPKRKEKGVTGAAVYRDPNDPTCLPSPTILPISRQTWNIKNEHNSNI